MDPKSYEEAVRRLVIDMLLLHSREPCEVEIRKVFHNSKSGQPHEIDLSFEVDLLGTRVFVLIECKAYARRVGLDDVLEFAARIDDLGAHKGILVTTVGFQQGAVQYAKANGIALVVVKVGRRRQPTMRVVTPYAYRPSTMIRPSSRYFSWRVATIDILDGSASIRFGRIDEPTLAGVEELSKSFVNQVGLVGGTGFARSVPWMYDPAMKDRFLVAEIIEPAGSQAEPGCITLFKKSEDG